MAAYPNAANDSPMTSCAEDGRTAIVMAVLKPATVIRWHRQIVEAVGFDTSIAGLVRDHDKICRARLGTWRSTATHPSHAPYKCQAADESSRCLALVGFIIGTRGPRD